MVAVWNGQRGAAVCLFPFLLNLLHRLSPYPLGDLTAPETKVLSGGRGSERLSICTQGLSGSGSTLFVARLSLSTLNHNGQLHACYLTFRSESVPKAGRGTLPPWLIT